MMTVALEKTPKNMKYLNEALYNNGFYWPHCETSLINHECHYIESGCTGCQYKNISKDNS